MPHRTEPVPQPQVDAGTLAHRVPAFATRTFARGLTPRRYIASGMRREFSAGGVVVRRFKGTWQFLAIRPIGRSSVWALPKGHIDGRESTQETAVREVREETGVRTSLDTCLGEVTYTFRIEGDPISKTVTFFLLNWQSGAPQPQRAEVDDAEWFDLEEADAVLTYPGEREMALKAAEAIAGRERHRHTHS